MNLVETIARDHSRKQTDTIVRYVGTSAERFSELVEVFFAGPYRITQRASWPLSVCVENHHELARPHLRRLLKNLSHPDIHDAVKRNTVRLLQFIHIPKSLQGIAAERCFALFQDHTEPIAIRVFSMTVLANIAIDQPDLKNELKLMIEDELPYASRGTLRGPGRL